MTPPRHDVAILGAGIAGSILGAVLARNGAKVLLLDAGTHPRFAIGESTIPYTSVLLKVVAARYDVPEIAHLASFQSVRKHVTGACGIKRNFGFVYQREGQAQQPDEVNQFVIPKMLHTENHFYRQDIDAYMAYTAASYGADLRQQTRIQDVDIDGSGVTLTTDRGETFLARYVVDASGHKAPVAEHFGLREQPTRFKHHSRSMFTHMVGVTPYDDVMRNPSQYGNPSPWHQGTLHHVFDGGWLWVIPFDNNKGGTNRLCSVGLTLDPRRHPRPDGPPQQEFDDFLRRFPDIAPQFKNARPVREWVSTGRLQYSTTSTVGDRFCITAHAAGFIDALYSRGLTNTLEVVNVLGHRLLDAIRDDDFSRERFAFVEQLEQGLLSANDDLVNSSFIAFRDYGLWNAVFRTWAISTVLGTFHLQGIYDKLRHGDTGPLREMEHAKYLGSPFPVHDGCNELLRTTTAVSEQVESGTMTAQDATRRLFAQLSDADFIPPPLGLDKPGNHFFHATPPRMARTVAWAQTKAPADISGTVTHAMRGFARERIAHSR